MTSFSGDPKGSVAEPFQLPGDGLMTVTFSGPFSAAQRATRASCL